MGPLKRMDIHAVSRLFDFSRQTGTSLGQNQWLCPKPKKTVGLPKPTKSNDSTPRHSIQRSVARRCVTHPIEEMSEITNLEHLAFRPYFQINWFDYATHQWTRGTYCWVWAWLPKGPQDSCPEPWPCGKDSARLRPINLAQDYFKSIKQATESGRFDDSNQRPYSLAQSTEGPSSEDELGHRLIAYIREARSNEKGIRKSPDTYFRLELGFHFCFSPTCTFRRTSFRRLAFYHLFPYL